MADGVLILHSSKDKAVADAICTALDRACHSHQFRKHIRSFKVDDILPGGVMEYYLSDTHWLDAITPPADKKIQDLVETVKNSLWKQKLLPYQKADYDSPEATVTSTFSGTNRTFPDIYAIATDAKGNTNKLSSPVAR